MSYMLKRTKYTIIQLEIDISIIFKQVLIFLSNVSARTWNVSTTNMDLNIFLIHATIQECFKMTSS